ncbi:MAG: hypothetical protein AB7S74_18960 [Hyphomicrobium sp.]
MKRSTKIILLAIVASLICLAAIIPGCEWNIRFGGLDGLNIGMSKKEIFDKIASKGVWNVQPLSPGGQKYPIVRLREVAPNIAFEELAKRDVWSYTVKYDTIKLYFDDERLVRINYLWNPFKLALQQSKNLQRVNGGNLPTVAATPRRLCLWSNLGQHASSRWGV